MQFQSGVLEVLNRAVTLGFAVARWLEKFRFCDRSQVRRGFWRKRVRVEMAKIIPSARTSYNFGCFEESDEKHFSWQVLHIVDLKVEKGDCQFQSGVLEVLNRAVTLGFVMQRVYPEVRFCEKSRGKRSFWKLGLSLFVKISWKMLVLEAWIVTFGELSWKMLILEAWIVTFGELSWKMLVLESWSVTFGESLLENARFGSLECHFQ